MNLLGHITLHEVSFVVAVFLCGIAIGFTMNWNRSKDTVGERSPRDGR